MSYKTNIYSVTSRINREGEINHQYDGRKIDVYGNSHSLKGIETKDMKKPYQVLLIEEEHERIFREHNLHRIKRLTTKITLNL